MSYVEYDGSWDSESETLIQRQVEQTVNELSVIGGENIIKFIPYIEMVSICPYVPVGLPANKANRVVVYCGDFGIPCGGTHVRNLQELGRVHIKKIKKKGLQIRVSYSLE